MVTNKQEFIRTFLPEKIEDISFAQIDLDITDLSLADVMRNVDHTYPPNSRVRNAIISGKVAVGVLCKSELLYPLSGVMIIISNGDVDLSIVSRNYMVIGISEERIRTDEEIKLVLDDLTHYIIKEFRHSIAKFDEFYVKFVYDPYEEDLDNQGYAALDDIYRKLMGKK